MTFQTSHPKFKFKTIKKKSTVSSGFFLIFPSPDKPIIIVKYVNQIIYDNGRDARRADLLVYAPADFLSGTIKLYHDSNKFPNYYHVRCMFAYTIMPWQSSPRD